MKIFVLEDNEERIKTFKAELKPSHEVTYAADVLDAMVKWNPPYDTLFLDHDLGGHTYVSTDDPNTGSEFLRRIRVDLTKENITEGIIIHSLNPVGAEQMYKFVKDCAPDLLCYQIPFHNIKGQLSKLG